MSRHPKTFNLHAISTPIAFFWLNRHYKDVYMLIGYARTSTIEQETDIETQITELQTLGATEHHLYSEQVSSVGKRKELDKALNDLRSGDTVRLHAAIDITPTKLD